MSNILNLSILPYSSQSYEKSWYCSIIYNTVGFTDKFLIGADRYELISMDDVIMGILEYVSERTWQVPRNILNLNIGYNKLNVDIFAFLEPGAIKQLELNV